VPLALLQSVEFLEGLCGHWQLLTVCVVIVQWCKTLLKLHDEEEEEVLLLLEGGEVSSHLVPLVDAPPSKIGVPTMQIE
jgi:hypothetical protein